MVWVIAQLHLLLAGFVLGVPIFAWLCEIVGWKSGDKRYDKLAKEFTKLLTSSYATTALFGGILLFLLIGFYPKLMKYLTDIFFPSFLVYCAVIPFGDGHAVSLLVWLGCHGGGKGQEAFTSFLGLLLNVFAFFIMIVPNSWATFQASPVVFAEGTDFERAWAATWNPTWWPVNIHRLIANVVLGGYICGAYAGIRYLSAKSQEERYHYDWMGYVGNFIGVFGLLPLAFCRVLVDARDLSVQPADGHHPHGRISVLVVHSAGHADRRLVPGVELLFLARHHPSNTGIGDAVSEADHGDVDHSSPVPGCLDDAAFARRQPGGGPARWEAPTIPC